MIMLKEIFETFGDIDLDHVHHGPGGYTNVFVTFRIAGLSISARGERLMQIENELIEKVSTNIRIWHVPIGDKNSLRTLRGVKLK